MVLFVLKKGLCASELLLDVICWSKVEPTYTQRERDQSCLFDTTDECRLKFANILPTMVQPSAPLKTLLYDVIRPKLMISLTFVDVFVQNCMKLIDGEKEKLLRKDLLTEAGLQVDKYVERVRGCQTKCPCCGRMCDVEHFRVRTAIGSELNMHRCTRGHQFRGMNGFKMERSNEPSFRICESMNDYDRIVYSGKFIKWVDYKKLHPTWAFEVDSQMDVNDWRARCTYIWSIVGEDLCQKFGMTHTRLAVDSQAKIADPIHFVLVLDDSGSMAGSRWRALIHSVTNFLKIRYEQGDPEDLVTIVFFSDQASIEVSSLPIHPTIVDEYNLSASKYHAGTNYSAALQRVIQAMTDATEATKLAENKDRPERKFGIVFMSDGEAEYPSAEIMDIKRNWLAHIYKFWCIGYGNDATFRVLRDMCKFVHGDETTFMNPQEAIELDAVYGEIAVD